MSRCTAPVTGHIPGSPARDKCPACRMVPVLPVPRSLIAPAPSVQRRTAESVLTKILEPDGGFTVDVDGATPAERYMVSPYPEASLMLPAGSSDEDVLRGIVRFLAANKELLSKDSHYMGGWNDPGTGAIYIDVSIATDDREEARQIALERDQIAFYDSQEFCSVEVNRAALSGQVA